MAKEESIFTVCEDEKLEKELFSVAEEYQMVYNKPEQSVEDKSWLETKDVSKFVQFLDEQMELIPNVQQIQGNLSKMENALSRWKKLNHYCSEALRSDFHATLDADAIDKKRQTIEHNIDTLEDAIDGINTMKQTRRQQRRQHRRRAEDEHDITKEATTARFQMVLTPFERGIAGALVNGKITGGRNIEELWEKAKKKYDMTPREELSILQVLADMGYPEFKDRLRLGEDEDPTEGLGEWQSQYQA